MLATLASERTDGLLADGVSHDSALNSGFHLAYLVGAGLVAIALAIAIVVLREAPMPAHGEADAAQGTGEGEPIYSKA